MVEWRRSSNALPGPILRDLRHFLEMLVLKLFWMVSWYSISMWNRPELAARHPHYIQATDSCKHHGSQTIDRSRLKCLSAVAAWRNTKWQQEGPRAEAQRPQGGSEAVTATPWKKQWDTHLPGTWWGGETGEERSVPTITTPFPLSASEDQFPLFCFLGMKWGLERRDALPMEGRKRCIVVDSCFTLQIPKTKAHLTLENLFPSDSCSWSPEKIYSSI